MLAVDLRIITLLLSGVQFLLASGRICSAEHLDRHYYHFCFFNVWIVPCHPLPKQDDPWISLNAACTALLPPDRGQLLCMHGCVLGNAWSWGLEADLPQIGVTALCFFLSVIFQTILPSDCSFVKSHESWLQSAIIAIFKQKERNSGGRFSAV